MKRTAAFFMIDDFGRQQVGRWISSTAGSCRWRRLRLPHHRHGNKIEIPFDELLIFSTNLDPKPTGGRGLFAYQIQDRDQAIPTKRMAADLGIVCKVARVEYDDKAIDYLVEKWYKPLQPPDADVPAAISSTR